MTNRLKEVFSKQALHLAWERYTRSVHRDSKDYLGVKAFRSNLEKNIVDLSCSVISGKFKASRPPKFFKPKASGMQRVITVLPVVDAIVYQAIANHVATILYDDLAENHDYVFGSILHDEVKQGLSILDQKQPELFFFKPYLILYKQFADSVNKEIKENEVTFKFETDITGFYDSIPHYNFLSTIKHKSNVPDEVLDILSDCLNIWSGTPDSATPGVGIPQATPASHFFANVFLHDLDNVIREQGLPYYRYMDDIRIYGYDEPHIRLVLVIIDKWLKNHALSLNAKKTRIEEILPETVEDAIIEFEYISEMKGSLHAYAEKSDFAIEELESHEGSFNLNEIGSNKELIELAYRDLKEVRLELNRVASPKERNQIDFNDRVIQRKFMSLGFKFRQAIDILRTSGRKPRLPQGRVLKGWFHLSNTYFWLIDHFCWVFNLYKNDETIKKHIILLLDQDMSQSYEWLRYELYKCIASSQSLNGRELQMFYRKLDTEHSWYAKRGLYLLLFQRCGNKQFLQSIISKAVKETDSYLIREILFMKTFCKADKVNKNSLLEEFGLL